MGKCKRKVSFCIAFTIVFTMIIVWAIFLNYSNETKNNNHSLNKIETHAREMPNKDVIIKAMSIIEEANGEITDDVKQKLLDIGLSEKQLEYVVRRFEKNSR